MVTSFRLAFSGVKSQRLWRTMMMTLKPERTILRAMMSQKNQKLKLHRKSTLCVISR